MIKEQEDPKLLRTFKGHKDEINSIAFHPQW
jgi:WD40 repeat protein